MAFILGKKTLKDNVLGTVASGPDGAGNTVTYRKVNKDAIEKSIQAEVKGNMAAMSNTGKVAFWNNILAEKDSRNNIKEGQVRTTADASTEKFNEDFYKAYSNYFLKRISRIFDDMLMLFWILLDNYILPQYY